MGQKFGMHGHFRRWLSWDNSAWVEIFAISKLTIKSNQTLAWGRSFCFCSRQHLILTFYSSWSQSCTPSKCVCIYCIMDLEIMALVSLLAVSECCWKHWAEQWSVCVPPAASKILCFDSCLARRRDASNYKTFPYPWVELTEEAPWYPCVVSTFTDLRTSFFCQIILCALLISTAAQIQ